MQPSRGCIVKERHARAYSAEDGTGADARPSASRTAGRSSAPPGRGQAAKAVFRRAGWPASGGCGGRRRPDGRRGGKRGRHRNARTRQRQPRGISPPQADAPMRKGPEREADVPEANLTIGERYGTRAKRPFPRGANGWGEITRTFGRERKKPHAAFPLLTARKSPSHPLLTRALRFSCPKKWGISSQNYTFWISQYVK